MIVNGYEIIGKLQNDNSGYAKWGFAKKGLYEEVFIKQFLSPVYPSEESGLTPKQIEQKIQICKDFEYKKRVFYNRLNRCITGNVVTINDFFRDGNRYYMVTEKVGAEKLEPEAISKMSFEQIMLIIKVLLYNVTALHKAGIVHGDLKPTNILFQKTVADVYTSKLIDFDSSFLEEDPPKDESELQGDMVYFAPESFLFVAEEEGTVNCKIDVFALGIIIHQYLTGETPYFDRDKYNYTFEAVLDGAEIGISPLINKNIAGIILRMLDKNPETRPSCEQIFKEIMAIYGPVPSVIKKNTNEVNVNEVCSDTGYTSVSGHAESSASVSAGTNVGTSENSAAGSYFRKVNKL